MTESGVRAAGNRRIALAAAHGAEFVTEDLPLIASIIAAGHKVLCLTPTLSETDELKLTHLGADVEEIDIVADRFTLMPERQVATRIAATLSNWNTDTIIIHDKEIVSPMAFSAKKAGIPRVIIVQGATQNLLKEEAEDKPRAVPAEMAKLMRALETATDILCINYDHAARLEFSGLLREGMEPVVLPWSGVDLNEFAVAPLPTIGGGLAFLMTAELSRSSGVIAFCEAARLVKERSPQTTFLLAGPASRADDALSVADLAPYREVVEYLGDNSTRRDLISRCHVFAYPSFSETNPGPALEALSMGRPVILADAPGCRELVDERVNGCLVRPDDAQSLAEGIESYLKRPDLIPAMARASRQKAERRFDRRLVMAAMFDLLGLERAMVETAGV